MLNHGNEEVGSFGYGFRVISRRDGIIEFQPTTIIKSVPTEFIIMQMQVFLDDLKKEYHGKYGKTSSREE
jgi:hypothetical protein